jgi:hypothetical protein
MVQGMTRKALLAAFVVAVSPAALAAQELPSAEAITTRYVEAIGGRETVLGAHTSHARGSFEFPAAGITGELEIFSAKPGKMLSKVTIPGLGVMRTGFDGTLGWALDPMSGARVMEGAELEAMRDQTNPLAAVRDKSVFTSMETVERTEIEGQACYKVKFVWKSGRESVDCYAVDTGLLVATTSTQESPMGAIETTMIFSDYRQVGDVKMPMRMTQKMMGQQQVMKFTTVEFDSVDPSVFELPAEIKVLVQP